METRKHGKLFWTLIIIAIVLVGVSLLALGGAALIFREELGIIGTIKQIVPDKPVYYMETNDYHFDEFLANGGAKSDEALSDYLTKKISKGLYKAVSTNEGAGCSVISCSDANGQHLWGRNFDWTDTAVIILRAKPADGYASLSTVAYSNYGGDGRPDNIAGKMLSVAAYYVPMDGVNEKGFSVADLEVNEGGMVTVDTEKSDLTITSAIRLLLNNAATVTEAVELLSQYDIFASGGISHHLALSDADGKAAVVEFTNAGQVVVYSECCTNFNMANGDTAAGGESAQQRYVKLQEALEAGNGVLTADEVRDTLQSVASYEGQWLTKWSLVYQHATDTVDFYFDGEFSEPYSFKITE